MDLEANWVAGHWMPATGETTVIVSPIDGEPLHAVRFAGDREIEAALAAATKAAAAMAATSQAQRARALSDLAAGLKRRAGAIAEATIVANGCPRKQALAMQVLSAVALLEAFAPLADTHVLQALRRGLRGGDVLVRKIPIGVSVGVVPWNAPVFLSAVKLAGAIAAGAPLILKPSPETVGATAWLAEALCELDLPAGVISVLHGGRDVGRKLVEDARVAKVSFTGGARGGLEVAATCARRLARCTLELGGKSAAVLLDDFDPATALPELMSAMLQNNGQICGAQTRLLIDRRIYERTLETLAAAFRALQVGDPRDAETDIGPVITAAQRDHLEAAVGAARSAGGRVIAGGGRPRDVPAGFYVAPTLIADLAPDAPQVREELFGPIIVALPFDSEEEAIGLANDSPYGLAGSVWTSDLERGAKFATGISAGTVSLNTKRILDFGSPFGGLRHSGLGRELGPEGIDAYLESQSVILPAGVGTN
jgi:aldehyde dehydrogenase (NAD+)